MSIEIDLHTVFRKPAISVPPMKEQVRYLNKANSNFKCQGGPLILACFHVASENRPQLDKQTRNDAMQILAAYQPQPRHGLKQAASAWARWVRAYKADRVDEVIERGIGFLFSCPDFHAGAGKVGYCSASGQEVEV